MVTHHFFMASSLLIKILKIDNFGDFSCDIEYNSRTDVFRDVIALIINQCDPRRPKGPSGGHKVSASRAAQASEACLYILKLQEMFYFYFRFLNYTSELFFIETFKTILTLMGKIINLYH